MDFCIYDDMLNTIQIIDTKLLHFKLSKSGQILYADKTGFPRPGHRYSYCLLAKSFIDGENFTSMSLAHYWL